MSEFEEMEMPSNCEKCKMLFDLNNGLPSQKWYDKTTIFCKDCAALEDFEIERDKDNIEIKELVTNIDNALTYIKKRQHRLEILKLKILKVHIIRT